MPKVGDHMHVSAFKVAPNLLPVAPHVSFKVAILIVKAVENVASEIATISNEHKRPAWTLGI